MLAPVPLGIALGLLVGKPVGIVGATWLAVRSGLAPRPEGASWSHIVGVGFLGGIGFTMSLFIGMLAFPDPTHAAQVRLGVLAGSITAAVVGYLLLAAAAPGRDPGSDPLPGRPL
jgi:NhaA family Na+:H+ antiporter